MPAFRSQNWEARWQRIDRATNDLTILPPIDVVRYGGRYWVEDGHNRVAAALKNGQVEVDAAVTELRPPNAVSSTPPALLAPMLEEGRELRAAGEGRFSAQAASLLASSAGEAGEGSGHDHEHGPGGHDPDDPEHGDGDDHPDARPLERLARAQRRRAAAVGPAGPPDATPAPEPDLGSAAPSRLQRIGRGRRRPAQPAPVAEPEMAVEGAAAAADPEESAAARRIRRTARKRMRGGADAAATPAATEPQPAPEPDVGIAEAP